MSDQILKQLFRTYDDGNLLISDEKYRAVDGYQHVQNISSKSWFIQHNKGTSSFSINVFLDNELVECNVVINDEYSVTLNFSQEVIGFANLLFLVDRSKEVIPPIPQYIKSVIDKNPIAYWSLTTSTLYDDVSGNQLSLGPNVSLVPDTYGNTLLFNQSSLQSGLGAFMATPLTLTNNYTLEAWVKFTSTVNFYSTIFGDSTGDNYGLQTDNSNGDLSLFGTNDAISSGYSLGVTSNYMHVVLVVDANSNADFYVNGIKVNTTTVDSQDTYTYGILGCDTYYTEAMIGYMGDPAIYNYALTSEQILENYNAGLNYRYSS